MDNNAPAVWKDYISAPRWAGVANALIMGSSKWNVDFVITGMDTGWFRTTVFFTVRGPMDEVESFKGAVRRMMNRYND